LICREFFPFEFHKYDDEIVGLETLANRECKNLSKNCAALDFAGKIICVSNLKKKKKTCVVEKLKCEKFPSFFSPHSKKGYSRKIRKTTKCFATKMEHN
jgi:hypothetical protein